MIPVAKDDTIDKPKKRVIVQKEEKKNKESHASQLGSLDFEIQEASHCTHTTT